MRSRWLLMTLSGSMLLAVAFAAEARGPWRASEDNTRGWQFMTPEERVEHQARVRGFKTLDECRAYQLEHHHLMEQRAKEKGSTMPSGGRDICEHLKSAS